MTPIFEDPRLEPIHQKVQAGQRLGFEDGVTLYRTPDLLGVGPARSCLVWGEPTRSRRGHYQQRTTERAIRKKSVALTIASAPKG